MLAWFLAAVLAQATPVASPEPAASAGAGDGNIVRRLPWRPPAVAASPGSAATAPSDAVIVDSGSTNTIGYTIVIHLDYSAQVTLDGALPRDATLPAADAKSLFARLAAAAPLDALTRGHCMKSASFGTSRRIAYAGKISPDLTCAGDEEARELAGAVGAIVADLGIPLLRPRGALRHPDF